jgi:uncharacterized protein (DUF1015 family)
MPRFEPFRGTRYAEHLSGSDVTCPPYDVISPDDRAALVARHEANAVLVELPEAEGDRYVAAADTLDAWLADGTLITDDEPSFYVYRMGFHDEAGRPRQTVGLIGAMELAVPGTGDVLPHERTTPKAKSDRLDLLRATRTNVSPVWGLSMAEGMSGLCDVTTPPVARATDADGVHHRLYRVTQQGALDTISEAVGKHPIVIADGHHRYQTGLNDQAEQPGAGPHDLIMTLVVELVEDQLSVRAIHRLLAGLPDGFDVLGALEPHFEAVGEVDVEARVLDRMVSEGALCLVRPGQRGVLLRPRQTLVDAAEFDLDSSRLEVALRDLPQGHEVTYQHGWDHVAAAVEKGEAQAAVLIRPATVAQILEVGRTRTLMPPKTTFFYPKPVTGLVMRRLDD